MTIAQIHSADEFRLLEEELRKEDRSAFRLCYARYELVKPAGGSERPAWDLLFYSPQHEQIFVVLDYACAPVRVPCTPPAGNPASPAYEFEGAPIPITALADGERLMPGLVDYASLNHHLKRYFFARQRLLPGTVLDCASGVGYGTNLLLHRPDVTRAVGVDRSAVALRAAGLLVKSPRAEFRDTLPDESFDNIVSLETIEHVPDPYDFVESLVARLKPGGQMIVSIPSEFWYGEYHITHWNYDRFRRFVGSYFDEVECWWQTPRGSDPFAAGELASKSWGLAHDFSFVAVLRGPRRRCRPRLTIRRTGDIGDVLTLSAAVEQLRTVRPECDLVAVTDSPDVFCWNPHLDLVATTDWSGPIDVDLDDLAADDPPRLLAAFQDRLGVPQSPLAPRLYINPADVVSMTKVTDGRPEMFCDVRELEDGQWTAESWAALLRDLTDSFDAVVFPAPGVVLPTIPDARVYVGTLPFALAAACVARADVYLGIAGSEYSRIADLLNKPSILIARPGTLLPRRLGTAAAEIVCGEAGGPDVAAVLARLAPFGRPPRPGSVPHRPPGAPAASAAPSPSPLFSKPAPAGSPENSRMQYHIADPQTVTRELDRLFPYTAVDPVNSIDARHRAFLYHLMMVGRFRHVLEVGTWIGYSTGAIIKALIDGAPSQVDLCDFRFQPQIPRLAQEAPPGRVRLIEQPSLQVIKPGYDFAFVDGDHSWPNLVNEIHLLLRAGIPNLLFHDTNTGALGEPQNAGPWIAKMILTQLPERYPRYYIDELKRPGERTERGLMLLTSLPRELVEPVWQTCMGTAQPAGPGDYGSSIVVGI